MVKERSKRDAGAPFGGSNPASGTCSLDHVLGNHTSGFRQYCVFQAKLDQGPRNLCQAVSFDIAFKGISCPQQQILARARHTISRQQQCADWLPFFRFEEFRRSALGQGVPTLFLSRRKALPRVCDLTATAVSLAEDEPSNLALDSTRFDFTPCCPSRWQRRVRAAAGHVQAERGGCGSARQPPRHSPQRGWVDSFSRAPPLNGGRNTYL